MDIWHFPITVSTSNSLSGFSFTSHTLTPSTNAQICVAHPSSRSCPVSISRGKPSLSTGSNDTPYSHPLLASFFDSSVTVTCKRSQFWALSPHIKSCSSNSCNCNGVGTYITDTNDSDDTMPKYATQQDMINPHHAARGFIMEILPTAPKYIQVELGNIAK